MIEKILNDFDLKPSINNILQVILEKYCKEAFNAGRIFTNEENHMLPSKYFYEWFNETFKKGNK